MILYISYDGILEPLGQSQVLQYLIGLSSSYDITLISYEKKRYWEDHKRRNILGTELLDCGIDWRPLRYHKTPSVIATAYDVIRGILLASWIIARKRIKIVHARSYVPSVIALFLKKAFKVKFIFDMRGFWADERVDGGLWEKNSLIYKIAKWFEKQFLLKCDAAVSLTKRALEVLKELSYLRNRHTHFQLIPTCVTLDIFKIQGDKKSYDHRIKSRFVAGYVGSAGTWYFFDETVAFFTFLKSMIHGSFLLLLNMNDHELITDTLNRRGISIEEYELISADYHHVPEYMASMDCGIFFIKQAFSKKASSPTRLGEFLACGKPVITNDIGDVAEIILPNKVGVIVNDFSPESFRKAIDEFLDLRKDPSLPARCRVVAERYFSLEQGIQKYSEIYSSLLNPVK